jgi:general transcription factor 3C polypeptide 3 (transcription factor C subunit 4)
MTNFQYQSEAYTLFTLAMTASRRGIEVFHNNANQKYLLRQIKLMDQYMSGEKRVGAAYLTAQNEDGTPYHPVQNDVTLLMLYGHILACGKSYISALNYYTRAYSVDPEHPHILFCIGLAYLHRSMQRQSDNRHLQAFQAMSFFFEYYDRRSSGLTIDDLPPKDSTKKMSETEAAKAEGFQEANYNLARAFHHLGLSHLAVPYYERVLEISERCEGRGLQEDLRWEAAYNLQGVYFSSGNGDAARRVTGRWLIV